MSLGEQWRRFRRFDERGVLIARVEGHMAYTANGYAFNRWYFRVAMLLFVVLVGFSAWANGVGWREHYASCPADAIMPCRNPFMSNDGLGPFCSIDDEVLCSLPVIMPGEEWGTRPPWLMRHMGLVLFVLVALAFVDNHLRYNRGRVPFDSWREK